MTMVMMMNLFMIIYNIKVKILTIVSNVIKTIVLTRCESVPVSVCGSGCVTREGEEECQDSQVAFIINIWWQMT